VTSLLFELAGFTVEDLALIESLGERVDLVKLLDRGDR
jgi:hypothetical protein